MSTIHRAAIIGGRRKYWTKSRVKELAQKYSDIDKFAKEANGAYQSASRNGFLHEVTSHMTKEYKNTWWDYDSVMEVASQFDVLNHFQTAYSGAAKWAKRHGIIDKIKANMETKHSDFDAVYIWKVEGPDPIYKIGVTSYRLGDKRIKEVARCARVNVQFSIMEKVKNACHLEKKLLSVGQYCSDFSWISNGFSEFRYMSSDQLEQCLTIINQNKIEAS